METKFNFKSQVCTDKNQSEHLLALGLKKETADMCYAYCNFSNRYETQCRPPRIEDIPAWSLHRLIEMADTTTYTNEGREDEHELWFRMDKCYCWNNHELFYSTNLYDSLINCIEWLIKEGYFNEEYLEEKK